MPGFNLSIGQYPFSDKGKRGNILAESIKTTTFCINRFTIAKFLSDKLFYQDDNYIIVIEGVILNKSGLIKNGQNWVDAVIDLYKTEGDEFFNKFRGTFSGLFFERKANKWLIFTDHIGSKHLYYSVSKNGISISSDIDDIYGLFKANKLTYNLNVNAAYMLLSYGYMLGNLTLCEQILKLQPGHYLHIQNGVVSDKLYYQLPKSERERDINLNDTIEELDEKFRNTIELQFNKDIEYGFKHLVALSGGLDSRMTSWVAHDMGYAEQINFTFSQSNYLDETIPKKIASDLKHEWIFKALDNGNFLKDIDEINCLTGGNVLYYGLGHGNSMLKLLNFDELGIIHSGQLGDVIIGSFIKKINDNNFKVLDGAYSTKYRSKVVFEAPLLNDIENKEIALFYQRGFNGANNGLLAFQKYSDTMSPFYNIDFLEYCLSIPIKYRIQHKLYKEWILKKYPQAGNYIWENTKRRINSKSINISFKSKQIDARDILPLIFYKLGLIKLGPKTKHHMNPLDYWYSTNSDIKAFQDKYFKEALELLNCFRELKDDVIDLYTNGTAIEKNQVLTLLSALRLYYC